jgi:hypothetical protein
VTKYRFNPQPDITAYELACILEKIRTASFDLSALTVTDSKDTEFQEIAGRHFERIT